MIVYVRLSYLFWFLYYGAFLYQILHLIDFIYEFKMLFYYSCNILILPIEFNLNLWIRIKRLTEARLIKWPTSRCIIILLMFILVSMSSIPFLNSYLCLININYIVLRWLSMAYWKLRYVKHFLVLLLC